MNVKEKEEGVYGTVNEALPNTLFRVVLDGSGEEKLAYLSGKMRIHRIKVLVGDRVFVTLDPYGGKGRITKRL
ncbi:MAG: translation initiation factor IF-1 [Candidatus Paceibacterota bacterium]|jgi:translation initiation factor IF-1|nr:translation initiation factor IF-1 [Candidatus Paceibacterota bacterium]